MAVHVLSVERFKGPTRPVPRVVTVATTVTEILKNNPDRFGWFIVNLSPNRGFLWWSRDVSASVGIPIEASGGFVSAFWEEDGETTTYELFGINEVASGSWSVTEHEVF